MSVGMMLQLNPPIPLQTPKGPGMAAVLIDYGPEYDLLWVVFLDATGECWSYRNSEVRARSNVTFGRDLRPSPPPSPLNGHARNGSLDGVS